MEGELNLGRTIAAAVGLATLLTAGWIAQSQVLSAQPEWSASIRPMRPGGPKGAVDLDPDDESGPPTTLPDEVVAAGRFREAPLDEAAQLAAIGYLAGSREAGEGERVTRYDPERAWQGLNLYNSGHEASAFLMDMEGKVLHEWRRPFDAVWPQWAGRPNENMMFWRRVHLLEDGSLLVVFEGLGLVKLDRDSNVVWARPNTAHHDLEVLEDGDILVLGRRVESPDDVEAPRPTLADYVLHLDPQGRERYRVSLMSAYARSPFGNHFMPSALEGGDSFHTNTLFFIRSGEGPVWQEGRVLLSMRHLNAVAVLDLRQKRIVWSGLGDFRLQHDVQQLEDGRLMLLDNGPPERRASRVLELNPDTGEILWAYEGTEEDPFWTATCGTAQRLPNGNTLITESDAGRAFEVTRDGEIVWEFLNPARPEEHPELVATLFEMLRLPPDFPTDWLEGEPAPEEAR